MYMQFAESTDNKLAIKVLEDIADEERIDEREFLRLLCELSPNGEKFNGKGAKEVLEEIEKFRNNQMKERQRDTIARFEIKIDGERAGGCYF